MTSSILVRDEEALGVTETVSNSCSIGSSSPTVDTISSISATEADSDINPSSSPIINITSSLSNEMESTPARNDLKDEGMGMGSIIKSTPSLLSVNSISSIPGTEVARDTISSSLAVYTISSLSRRMEYNPAAARSDMIDEVMDVASITESSSTPLSDRVSSNIPGAEIASYIKSSSPTIVDAMSLLSDEKKSIHLTENDSDIKSLSSPTIDTMSSPSNEMGSTAAAAARIDADEEDTGVGSIIESSSILISVCSSSGILRREVASDIISSSPTADIISSLSDETESIATPLRVYANGGLVKVTKVSSKHFIPLFFLFIL